MSKALLLFLGQFQCEIVCLNEPLGFLSLNLLHSHFDKSQNRFIYRYEDSVLIKENIKNMEIEEENKSDFIDNHFVLH